MAFHDSNDLITYTTNRFVETYNNSGQAAGTYTRPNTSSTVWTRH